MNYYNDNDKFSVKWLKALIMEGLIPPGDVDERSIKDVSPSDLDKYTQCHFFAGIGGWSYALQLADWGTDRPVWTGSCPCQPFSSAGKRKGVDDGRHLWPAFRWLIAQCKPSAVFGEQVASPLGRQWLTGVQTDLEGMGYRTAGADLCAASVGAPHIRQRLFWVADSDSGQRKGLTTGEKRLIDGETSRRQQSDSEPESSGESNSHRVADPNQFNDDRTGHVSGNDSGQQGPAQELSGVKNSCRLGEPNSHGPQPGCEATTREGHRCAIKSTSFWYASGESNSHRVVDTGRKGLQNSEQKVISGEVRDHQGGAAPESSRPPWAKSIATQCQDGKYRRISPKPALFPLAPRVPKRVGLLRGAGNSINPWVAAEFIRAFMEV